MGNMSVDCMKISPQPEDIISPVPTLKVSSPSLDCIAPVPRKDISSFSSQLVPQRESAIKVENVWKNYDTNTPVLVDFNMTVPKGSIYALLGSSGCGKTTILNCIAGRQTWDRGTISVLGSKYKTKCHVDPKTLGWMPQDLALQPLLTIREVITLYGRLHGMSHADIDSRFEFLQGFLELPDENKMIGNLSGGQRRRVSLGATLLHEPDLIILDEPTVGLDPLLRQSIWEHLQDLVTKLQVTIVLSTHYVDEARKSDIVGLMRHGQIIAQNSPSELQKIYETTSLDTIVLQICKRHAESITLASKSSRRLTLQNGNEMTEVVVSSSAAQSDNDPKTIFYAKGRLTKTHGEEQIVTDSSDNEGKGKVTFLKYSSPTGANSDGLVEHSISPQPSSFPSCFTKGLTDSLKSRRKCVSSTFHTLRRIRALIWATYMATFKHPAFIPLTFILPAVTAAMVQYVFGSDLRDLKFGYVNNDEPFSNNISSFLNQYDEEQLKANCFETKFSHLFLSRIPAESLTLIPYPSKEDALKAVEAGNIWGFVNIPFNYTRHMEQRMLTKQFSEIETIDGTIIGIHLDMSNFLGSVLIIKKLSEAYESYLKQLGTSCGLPSEEFELPLKYENPVYGKLDGTYGEHVVPGLILVIIFVLPLGACSVSVIQERNEGSMGRMRVAGMSNWDIIITYYVTHGSFQIVQMTLCTLVLVFGFSYVIRGPILLYIILNCCNAFCGLAIGFWLGLVCSTELHSLIVTFFIASILIPFSGAFWPIESLAPHWRMLAYSLPTTLTAQSFRSVVFRGLSYFHPLVWPGLAVPLIWMSVFLTFALLMLRRY